MKNMKRIQIQLLFDLHFILAINGTDSPVKCPGCFSVFFTFTSLSEWFK